MMMETPRHSSAPLSTYLVGIGFVAAIAFLALAIGVRLPVIGGPVIAIVLGVVMRSFFTPGAALTPGLRFSAKVLLQAAIIVSGFGLSFTSVIRTSIGTFPVTVATVAVAFLLTPLVGRRLGLEASVRRLIGVGTAICGASAIAAVAAVTEPDEADLAVSVATIFLYNVAAVLLFPPIGRLLHLSQTAFGVWAGTAINDTSSVVAAGFIYGHAAGQEATIVKLARATLILPIVAFIALRRARASRENRQRVAWRNIVPWFIVYFLIAAIVNTTGIVPNAFHAPLAFLSLFLITTALAAIGLQTPIRSIVRAGYRPLALGLVLWLAVAATSLITQHLIGL